MWLGRASFNTGSNIGRGDVVFLFLFFIYFLFIYFILFLQQVLTYIVVVHIVK